MLAYGFESQKLTQSIHPTKSIFDHFILVLAFLLYENGSMPIQNWGEAMAYFLIKFEGRI